ncbi:MAG: tRNA preQ1(34) S-adenosylmethionine ribosyltransferase-isomerase QueA [Vulcanimicrobiaceae bacterium]
MRRTAAYRYDLAPERIAKTPAEPADAARLLVLGDGGLADATFASFPSLLAPNDVLVINETRVVRARLRGERAGGGAAEILLLRPAEGGPFDVAARSWHALVRPGRRLRAGDIVRVAATDVTIAEVRADGSRVVRLPDDCDLGALLERSGELALPPYVGSGDAARSARYQTIFARVPGSVAAPTASLHFTPRVMEAIRARGTTVVPLVLDVGIGTFKPMAHDRIDDHAMHAERYAIPERTAEIVNAAKAAGRRIVVAGTTAMRALEASAAIDGRVRAGEAETEIFITPGFPFRIADALLTNFHLPASTLLVLVTAFGGYDGVMNAYRHAIARDYRFYSFGDAMFVPRAASVD